MFVWGGERKGGGVRGMEGPLVSFLAKNEPDFKLWFHIRGHTVLYTCIHAKGMVLVIIDRYPSDFTYLLSTEADFWSK